MIITIDDVEIKVLDGRILARRLDGQPLTDEDRLLATLVAATRPRPPEPRKHYSDIELEVADLIVRCHEVYCLLKLVRYNLQTKAAEMVMSSVTYRRLEGKNIVACKVFSPRAKDSVWLIHDDKHLSDDEVDGKAIFYFSEIPYLTNLEPDQLLSILRYKAVFPRSKVVQSDQDRRSSGNGSGGHGHIGVRVEKKKKEGRVQQEVFVQKLTDDDIARLVKIDPAQKVTDDDLKQVTEAWNEIGLMQTPHRLTDHWGATAKWLNTLPKTIRYMNKQQLAALREEIIAALLATPFGATRERAEKLTVDLLSVERLPWPPEPKPRNSELLNEQPQTEEIKVELEKITAIPFLDTHGNLVIPFNCDPRYRWWSGGQSIAETLDEINTQVRGKFMKLKRRRKKRERANQGCKPPPRSTR